VTQQVAGISRLPSSLCPQARGRQLRPPSRPCPNVTLACQKWSGPSFLVWRPGVQNPDFHFWAMLRPPQSGGYNGVQSDCFDALFHDSISFFISLAHPNKDRISQKQHRISTIRDSASGRHQQAAQMSMPASKGVTAQATQQAVPQCDACLPHLVTSLFSCLVIRSPKR